jgi:hypothetical protein
MKVLIPILIGLLVVGCGKNKQTTTEDPTPTTNTNKADGITEKPAEKLTAKEVTEVMAWEIGTWEVKGRGMPVGGEPQAIEMTMEARWKETDKSVEYKFTMEESGKTVSYFGHKKYDADKGVFIYRSKWGENPETTSHERYNPKTRTFYSESLPATPPTGLKSTAIHKRIGNDKTEQKLEVREGIRLVYSHEIVSVRVGGNQTTKKKEPVTKEDIVGTYELKIDKDTTRLVFQKNGVVETYSIERQVKKLEADGKWKMVDGKIHVEESEEGKSWVKVYRINKGGSITYISYIMGAERRDWPKEHQDTYKKIK